MLDLSFNQISKFYEAPLQLKANGGVFVVDDFGRQRIRPRDLLNRWIVPLESRDRLPDHAHRQEVRDPVRRADRVRHEPQSGVARRRSVPAAHSVQDLRQEPDAGGVLPDFRAQLPQTKPGVRPRRRSSTSCGATTSRAAIEMRACQPRDLIEQVVNLCRYDGRDPAISRELLDKACASYFLDEQAARAAPARPRRPARARAPRAAAKESGGMASVSPTVPCAGAPWRASGDGRGRGSGAHRRVHRPRVHQQPVR